MSNRRRFSNDGKLMNTIGQEFIISVAVWDGTFGAMYALSFGYLGFWVVISTGTCCRAIERWHWRRRRLSGDFVPVATFLVHFELYAHCVLICSHFIHRFKYKNKITYIKKLVYKSWLNDALNYLKIYDSKWDIRLGCRRLEQAPCWWRWKHAMSWNLPVRKSDRLKIKRG